MTRGELAALFAAVSNHMVARSVPPSGGVDPGGLRGFFEHLGYSPAAATIFALLCTESPRQAADYGGTRYWVATGPRGLPHGACTSPAISNQIVRKLDCRLTGVAGQLSWQYTCYADDLTFSAGEGKRPQIGMLMAKVRHIAQDEGFALNPRKGRVQRAGGRQTVTGIIVNDKLSVPREEVRRPRDPAWRAEDRAGRAEPGGPAALRVVAAGEAGVPGHDRPRQGVRHAA